MSARRPGLGWLLCGAALALRAGWVAYRWWHCGPHLDYPDEELHWQLATHLLRDGVLVTDDGRFAARMPLYPLFLTLFAGLGSSGILLARLVQAVLGAGTVGLAIRLAGAVSGRRAGIVAGVLVCCDPFGIFFSNLLLTEVLFTLLALAFTACAWEWLEAPDKTTWGTDLRSVRRQAGGLSPSVLLGTARQAGRKWGALLGLALLGALLVLTRPAAIGWVVLLWLLLAGLAGRSERWRRTLPLLACPIALAAFLLPWGLRNQAVLGSWAWLSTNGGVTLYDAQGPQADGSSDQTFLRELPALQGLDEVTLDRVLTRLALQQMRADPLRAIRLAGTKLIRTWSLTPNVAEYRAGFAAYAGAAYTLILLVGAAASTLRGVWEWRRIALSRGACYALVWLPVLFFTLVHCVYVGSVRYRTPLLPFLALAAALQGSDNAPPSSTRNGAKTG